MKRRPSEQTKVVIDIIEERVNRFAGDPTIPLDDIIVEFRTRVGGRLEEARRRVTASLPAALTILFEDGMYSVRVTEYYQKDIIRSVALGSFASTYALHFCPSDDCELFMQWFDTNASSGEGKVKATVEKMKAMASAGMLTPDGITKIATNASLGPRKDIRQVARIAARTNQQELPKVAAK